MITYLPIIGLSILITVVYSAPIDNKDTINDHTINGTENTKLAPKPSTSLLSNTGTIGVHFEPTSLSDFNENALPWGEKAPVRITFDVADVRKNVRFEVRYDCEDDYNCHVVERETFTVELNEGNNFTATINLTIEATFLGVTYLIPVHLTQLSPTPSPPFSLPPQSDRMRIVTLKTTFSEQFSVYFTILMVVFVVVNTFMMGTQLQWAAIVHSAKKPVGPVIGFVCQFGLMPLLAFGWSFLIPDEYTGLRLGFFAVGCSPGGGASNFWTILLDGNLDLSVTMTCISNFAALATMPFWLYTLGSYFFRGTVTLPFLNIVTSLLALIIPAGCGFLFGHMKPKVVPTMKRYIKIITLVPVSDPLLRRDDRDARTIMVETGIQNGGVAILLVQLSLEAPYRDMAIVMPVSVMMFASLPLWIWLGIRSCRRRCCPDDTDKVAPMTDSVGLPDKSGTTGGDGQVKELSGGDVGVEGR